MDGLISGETALVKLDIDRARDRPTMHEIIRKLTRAGYWPLWMSETVSPSGKGFHIILALEPEPKTAEEVVALQAILGSDPQREACNLWRARMLPKVTRYWRERWNVLYLRPRSGGMTHRKRRQSASRSKR